MEYKWGYKLYRSPRTEESADQVSDNGVNTQLRMARQETELWKVAVGKVRKKNWRIIFNVLIWVDFKNMT
jgi:hypothetical protein